MSLQSYLETSSFAQWAFARSLTDDRSATEAHPSAKLISYEADRGIQANSLAANIVSDMFLKALDAGYSNMFVVHQGVNDEIFLDALQFGEVASEIGDTITRRLMFLAGFMDYPPKPMPHHIRIWVRGQLSVWEGRKTMNGFEVRRVN